MTGHGTMARGAARVWAAAAVALMIPAAEARVELIAKESEWRYHAEAEPPGEGWQQPGFDDSGWSEGRGAFGTKLAAINTPVLPAEVTAWFRKTFTLERTGDWEHLEFELRMDDGAVIYINGVHVARSNMPPGPVGPETLALGSVSGSNRYARLRLPAEALALLRPGTNVVAAEVHQYRVGSSDFAFDFALTAALEGVGGETVIEERSVWRYLDGETPPEAGWKGLGFDDQSWREGSGILGYGDADVATVLDFGPDPDNKFPTAWFRKTFVLGDGPLPDLVRLRFLRDDGIIVHLNGRELVRDNMPPGFVDAWTEASTWVNDSEEREVHERTLSAEGLVDGENVLAVEIHQKGARSSDLAFDLAMEVVVLPAAGDEAPVIAGAPERPPARPRDPVRTPDPKPESPEVRPPAWINVADIDAVSGARREDWKLTAEKLLESALEAHGSGNLQDAARRYYAARWAEVFSGRQADLDAALEFFLLQGPQAPVSQEFFDLLDPSDDQVRVFEILNALFGEQESVFRALPRLAMAIALVYDQAPPRDWPHHQVAESILPRRLPEAAEALRFWSSVEERGKSLHPLDSLTIEELKFVVDTPATFEELEEAHSERLRLNRMDEIYSGIAYVHERARANIHDWPHERYTLADIRLQGGICVDQAYFTTQVAKAHGVPSMVVSGTGRNGNHAWVGFLDQRGRWNFDTGRYPESRFVSGVTHDPQTWRQPTDHELAFLSERFRSTSGYRASRIYSLFAREYLERDRVEEAIAACRAAISSESRNLDAWEILIEAKERTGAPPADLQTIFADGAKAFSRYADLEAGFLRRLSASHQELGDTEEAAKLRDRIIARNRRERPDLALQEAGQELEEARRDATPEAQLDLYKSRINRFREAGLIAYYAITEPFLEHLVDEGRTDLATEALAYTRRRMEPDEDDSQLEEEYREWEARITGS